jgi:hypothetical protein
MLERWKITTSNFGEEKRRENCNSNEQKGLGEEERK